MFFLISILVYGLPTVGILIYVSYPEIYEFITGCPWELRHVKSSNLTQESTKQKINNANSSDSKL